MGWKHPKNLQEGLENPPSLWQETEANQGTVWKALDVYRGTRGHCSSPPRLPSPVAPLLLATLEHRDIRRTADYFFPQIIGGKGLWGVGKG